MDDQGASILGSLMDFPDVVKIVEKLSRELEISPDEIAQEMQRFFEVLQSAGLLGEDEPPAFYTDPEKLRPRSLYVHLTARCNLNCLYCYNRKQRESWEGDMPFPLAKQVLIQAKEMEVTTIVFTGGEPLLNPHALKIIEAAHDFGFRVVLLTNGILIDKAQAKELARFCDQIVVSLDSPNPVVHESLRGKGTHTRVERAIKELQEAGAKEVVISGVITRITQFESSKEFDNYAQKIGADRAVRQIYILQGNIRDNFLAPDFDALLADMEKHLENMIANDSEPEALETLWRDRCGAAFGEIAVAPDGSVYPCQGLIKPEFEAGNVVLTDLLEIWKKSGVLARVRAITVDQIPGCCACPFRYLCGGGCRALAYTVYGSLTAPIPEGYCRFNRIIAEQKLWATAFNRR